MSAYNAGTDLDDRFGAPLLAVLKRIDLATRRTTRTCETCGCLCLPGENCPGCRASERTCLNNKEVKP